MKQEQCAENLISVLPLIFKKFKRVYHITDMPRQQLELLFKIGKFDGKPISFYSESMKIPKSNLTGASHKLVEDGLVVRESSEEDRRLILLKITDKGRTYLDIYKKQVRTAMAEKLNGYSEEELFRMTELLGELKLLLEKEAE